MKKILIIDDHTIFVESLSAQLNRHANWECLSATSINRAFEILEDDQTIDLILLDLHFPGIDGISFLNNYSSQCPVVILSSSDDIAKIRQAVDAGACGYLSKSVTVDDLISAIFEVDKNKQYFPVDIKRALERADSADETAELDNKLEQLGLTRRQYNVLCLIAQGLTNRAISERLNINIETVRTHAKIIYSCLQVNNRVSAVNEAKRLGLLE